MPYFPCFRAVSKPSDTHRRSAKGTSHQGHDSTCRLQSHAVRNDFVLLAGRQQGRTHRQSGKPSAFSRPSHQQRLVYENRPARGHFTHVLASRKGISKSAVTRESAILNSICFFLQLTVFFVTSCEKCIFHFFFLI